MLRTLVGDELEVPLVGGGTARGLNLDYAASAPVLPEVRDTVNAFLPWYSSVHRGAGYKSQISTEIYEAAREDVARFVNARPDDSVVFVRNTTDALNMLADSLPEGARVIVFDTEHHANLLPWRRRTVVHLTTPPCADDVPTVLAEALAEPGPGDTLVAITGASNVTGEVWPVADVVRTAHDYGARVVVDAAQLAAHGPVDLAAWDADWLAMSGHKLYAPYGAGVLVGRSTWIADGEPFLRGGGAVRFVTLDQVSWADLPDRQEAGSPNVVGAVALAAACRALTDIGMDSVAAHEAVLEAHGSRVLDTVPGLQRYRTWDQSHPRIGVMTFNLSGLHHSLVATALSAEYGIAVRDGCFCAHPLLLRLLGVPEEEAETIRRAMVSGDLEGVPGAVRASAGLATTREHLDRLAGALTDIAASGPKRTYRFDHATGHFVPDPDDRPLPPLPFHRREVAA